jgi:hypothetical protein
MNTKASQRVSNLIIKIRNSWLEIAILAALAAAIGRSIYFINIGFDPHHDYYALAPGLFASEGLLPHKDFYTHYGAVDAALKGLMLTIFGKTLISLRVSLLLLNYLGLICISYCCELKRRERIWLLLLVLIWASFDYTSAKTGITSFGHFLAWSSDLAIFLICILTVVTYWSNKLFANALRNIRASESTQEVSSKTHTQMFNNSLAHRCSNVKDNASFPGRLPRITLEIVSGFLLGCIFFTKFTIGLSMIAGVVASKLLMVGLTLKKKINHDKHGMGSNDWGVLHYINEFFGKDNLIMFSSLAFGMILSFTMQVKLIGGLDYLNNYINDIFRSQFQYFAGGQSIGLVKRLFPVIINDYSVAAILITILLFASLTRRVKLLLWVAIAISMVVGNKIGVLGLIRGQLAEPNYTRLLSYSVASIVLIGCIKKFTNAKSYDLESNPNISYMCTVLPIGVFSLTQFYPLSDGLHAWWAVGTALPAAAYLINERSELKKQLNRERNIAILASVCLCFTFGSVAVNATVIRGLPIHAVLQKNGSLLKNVRSVDEETSNVVRRASILTTSNPNLILLESGQGSFLDILGSPGSRRAYSECKIKPLSSIPKEQYSVTLSCLQSLRNKGWDVAITDYGGNRSGDPRNIGKVQITQWAFLSYAGEPEIVKEAPPGMFARKSDGDFVYWSMN